MDNKLVLPCDIGEVSDGYHTFNELYEHRHLLFLNFLNCFKEYAFKTKKHEDDSSYDGWFIAGINTVYGQITYHLPDRLFNMLKIQEIPKMPFFDKHTPNDVLSRLRLIIKTYNGTNTKDIFLQPDDESRYKLVK